MKKIHIILVVAVAVAVAFGAVVYVVRTQQLLQQQSVNSHPVKESSPVVVDTKVVNQEGANLRSAGFGYEQLLPVIGSLNEEQRRALLSDSKLFSRFVSQEALRRSLIDAANASQFPNDVKVKFLLQRQTDDFLISKYIDYRLQVAGIPEGFPSEQQIRQFYETNKQRYMLAERVPVWQIFWPISTDASKPEVAKLLKKASLLANDIRKGKTSFEQAALANSRHPASRVQGGYMGMLLTGDLRPKIKNKLLVLKVNTVSKPIRGENGVHLFRRGAIQPAEMLPLGQVRNQVIKELIQALRAQQRTQLNQLVQSQFPVKAFSAGQLNDWMRRAADSYRESKVKK